MSIMQAEEEEARTAGDLRARAGSVVEATALKLQQRVEQARRIREAAEAREAMMEHQATEEQAAQGL